MTQQRIGLHVSAAGGIDKAPDRAQQLTAECFQFFSRSPRGGQAPVITPAIQKSFKAKCNRLGLESYIHTPYYLNFASPQTTITANTARLVREEMLRASQLDVKYVITHLGSAKGWPGASRQQTPRAALIQTITCINEVFQKNTKFSAKLLLEIAAGAGNVIGDSFEELAFILKHIKHKQVYVCLDTAHLLASGYDIRTKQAITNTMKLYRQHLGLNTLKLVHANDSKVGLGERKDQHEHIGRGKIGQSGFKALLAHQDFQHLNFILETRHDKHIANDIRLLKKWRKDS